MRKLTLLSGTLLILALALMSGLSSPKPAWALCYCDPYEPYSYTPQNWGKGTSCSAAHSDLLARTAADARADCGATNTCLGNLIITGPCTDIGGGMYREDGYREYKCKVCGPIGP